MHLHPGFLVFGGIALLSLATLSGCASQPNNPSFAVAVDQSRQDLRRMAEDRRPLDRPLVLVGGFLDPGVAAWIMQIEFSAITTDRRIIGVSLEPSAFPIVSYVRLGDRVVGESNSAEPGQNLFWLPNQPLSGAHGGAFLDPRIVADIAPRLRGETPWAKAPAAPLPHAA